MDLTVLCQTIALPDAVTTQVLGFEEQLLEREFQNLVEKLSMPDSAESAYNSLKAILQEDDMAMLACQLQAAVISYGRYGQMGIPDDIFCATMKCFARFLEETYRMCGEYRYDRGFWSYRQVSMQLFRIGELEYELLHGEGSVSIHIPSDACFEDAAVAQSLEEARNFLKKYYPQFCSAPFVCGSWLLSPELKELLKPDSNILKFQNRFRIQRFNPHSKSFYQWLFAAPEDCPVEALCENTSLQRSVKKHLERGGIIGSAYGVLNT